MKLDGFLQICVVLLLLWLPKKIVGASFCQGILNFDIQKDTLQTPYDIDYLKNLRINKSFV
jgi:hypothetical protein